MKSEFERDKKHRDDEILLTNNRRRRAGLSVIISLVSNYNKDHDLFACKDEEVYSHEIKICIFKSKI